MQPTTEMQFGRQDSPSVTIASAYPTGQVTITVQNTEVPGHACDNELTLGQSIQLRDFLNRHIDSFALSATGSLAQRAADDPTQLAAEELLQLGIDAVAPTPIPTSGKPGQVWGVGPDGRTGWCDLATPLVQPAAGILHLVWSDDRTECVGFYDADLAARTSTGNGPQHRIPAIGEALRQTHRVLLDPLPQTTVTFF